MNASELYTKTAKHLTTGPNSENFSTKWLSGEKFQEDEKD